MEIHELVIETKLLECRLTLYEEKYGVLSEDFYNIKLCFRIALLVLMNMTKPVPILADEKVSMKPGCVNTFLTPNISFAFPKLLTLIQEILTLITQF